jgi:hypothetical protein
MLTKISINTIKSPFFCQSLSLSLSPSETLISLRERQSELQKAAGETKED